MPENQINSSLNTGKHGGARRGAGRKHSERWLEARGLAPMTASEVIALHGERRMWHRLLNSDDDRIVLQAWLALVSWRDGKPAQRINITSTNLTLNASELDKARAIVAEIRSNLNLGTPSNIEVTSAPAAASLMLSGDEGGKKDGGVG